MECEILAPTPTHIAPTAADHAPTASEGMDIDSPQQMQLERQSETFAEQREQISGLEQSKKSLSERLQHLDESAHLKIEALNKEITQLKEIIHEYRHGDHDMSDAFAVDTHGRVGEVTESYSQTINMQRPSTSEDEKVS